MKIYYLKWYEKNCGKMTTMIINESQKRLIDFLTSHFSIDDILYEHDIDTTITEEDEEPYNLAV